MRASTYIAAALATATVIAAPPAAHAGIGVGLFVGEPLGLTIKADLKRRTAIEVLLGVDDYDNDRGRDGYAHLTFLASPFVAKGESVLIPFRLGIGAAVYDDGGDDDVEVGVRAPFQLAFQFRSTPIELYLEISLLLELIDEDDNDDLHFGGGLGFRMYF